MTTGIGRLKVTKLIASLVVRNEVSRYLEPCIASLLEYCDEVRVLDDGSVDGTEEVLLGVDGVEVLLSPSSTFYQHEGQTRQRLLEHTLEGNPTHILAIDADEMVSSGTAVRDAVSGDGDVWTLKMTEIWAANESSLYVRTDRQWSPRPVPILYRVPDNGDLRILDRQLACGREPVQIRQHRRPIHLDVQVLHFGWTNPEQRELRYARYTEHDGGAFHASAHLLSILDGKEILKREDWPEGLLGHRHAILQRSGFIPSDSTILGG